MSPARLAAVFCTPWSLALLLTASAFGAGKPVSPAGIAGFVAAPRAVQPLAFDEEAALLPEQFDSTSRPTPPNLPSLGFAATGTSEFGDLIRLGGPAHFVANVSVTLSSWAIRSDYPGSLALGFTHPITLSVYEPDFRGGDAKPGVLLARVTQNFLVPWRPEPNPASSSPLRPWQAADGNHYTGRAFDVNFDLGSLELSLPHEIIVTIAFNTSRHGPAPLGRPGPYDELHLAFSEQAPAAGTDVEPDAVFWLTDFANVRADGAAGTGMLRRDTGWLPYKPAFRINDSAYGLVASADVMLRTLVTADGRTELRLDRLADLTEVALNRRFWDGHDRLDPYSGQAVFDLLAEAAIQLAALQAMAPELAAEVQPVVDGLVIAAQALAETASADAIIGGGDAPEIADAHEALDAGFSAEARRQLGGAIDQFGRAWEQSQRSLLEQ